MTEDDEQRWRRLLATERDLFAKASHVADDKAPDGSAGRSAHACDWFSASAELLLEYVRVHGPLAEAPAYVLENPPLEAIHRLAKVAEGISSGHIPDVLRDARADVGRPERHPNEVRGIAMGIFYIDAAKGGLIVDSSYTKTVSEAFGVTKRVVQQWVRSRDKLCNGLHPPESADQLTAAMVRAGKRYRFNKGNLDGQGRK